MLKYSALIFLTTTAFADPRPQMNQALRALDDLLPYIAREEKFLDKKNEARIAADLAQLEKSIGNMKHEELLKNDLFAPSYALIKQSIAESHRAFKEGNKDYAHWRLGELTNQCLDCHTRLPESYSSNYQEKKLQLDPKRFDSLFDLGTAQMIVRDYASAEKSFLAVIEDNLQKKKFMDTDDAFRNLLTIRTKVRTNYKEMLSLTEKYARNKVLPMDIQEELTEWEGRLKEIQKIALFRSPLKDDQSVKLLLSTYLEPVKEKDDVFLGKYDVYLLASSGLLSRYLFSNPDTKLAPEISYWIGWSEKVLKRDRFFSSGDSFLKQCIRRYPKSSIAPKCLQALKESTEFEFTGSSGTQIPPEVQKELSDLEALIKNHKS